MLLRHSTYYVISRGIPGLITFLGLAVYTRLLAPEQFGQYSLVMAGVGLADVVIFQWLRLVLARYLPAHLDDAGRFLGGVLAFFLTLSASVPVIGFLLALWWTDPLWQKLVALAVPVLIGQAWFQLNLIYSASSLNPARYGRISVSKAVLALLVGGWLSLMGLGAYAPLVGLLVGYVFAASVFGHSSWRGVRPRWASAKEVRRQLRYGLPLTLSFALSWVVSASDRFIIVWLLDEAAVGIYAIGYDLAQNSLGLLLAIVHTAAYPLAVRAFEKQGKEGAREQLAQNGSLIFAIALASAVGLNVMAPAVVELLVGAEFRSGALSVVPWIAVAAAVAGIKSFYLDVAFHLQARTRTIVIITAVSGIGNVALNLLLIPRFGIVGAAWSTLAAFLMSALCSTWLGRRIFPMPSIGPLLLKGAATAIAAGLGGKLGLIIFASSPAMALVLGVMLGGFCALMMAILLDVGSLREVALRRLPKSVW